MNLAKLNLGAIVIVITLFLWLGADFFFGEFAATASRIILMYLMLMIAVHFAFKEPFPDIPLTSQNLVIFVITGTITTVGILALSAAANLFLASFEVITAVSFGFFYAFVKAFIEEDIFRWVLARKLNPVASSILFGLFHFSVLFVLGTPFVVALVGMTFLAILGHGWYILSQFYGKGSPSGLMASTGSHFGYNLIALGALGAI